MKAPQRSRVIRHVADDAAGPVVAKCDPPSWWVGSSLNPIRIMLTGKNLAGARMSCDGARIGAPKSSASGRYLFVDLKLPAKAAPGTRTIKIVTPGGEAAIAFAVLPNVARKRALPRLSSDDVIYLIMPDRFAQGKPASDSPLIDRSLGRSYHGGNLRGIIDKLGYLKDLGVTTLWLTPLYANSDRPFPPTYYSKVAFTNYHGYGPVDFYGVDRRLGTPEVLKELVAKAHAEGLKIILDQVANHTSPHHAWVADPPTPSWYHGTTERHVTHPFYHWMAADPYATDESKRAIMDGWLGDELPDLNQGDPEVEKYLIQQMLWWAGVYGIDAWRHDSANYVPAAFWRKATAALRKEFPGFPNIAEINSDDPYLQAFYLGKNGADACFDFPLRRAVRGVFLEGKPMSELPAALSRDGLYSDPGMMITFAGLHDDSRFMGYPNAGPDALKLAFSFLMTTRGVPMVYAGDEIAMPGGDDPDNRRDFPGGWPGDARDAFTDAGRTSAEQDVFDHVRRLANLRASCEPLRRGRLMYLASNETLYAYARLTAKETVVVVLNKSDKPAAFEFPAASLRLPPGASLRDRLAGGRARAVGDMLEAEVAARSASVFTLKREGKAHG